MKLKIEDMGMNFEGVARNDNKVVFVPFALTDELVNAEILQDKKNFAFAKLIDIVEPSKERVTPFCPYFSVCGGCDLQHLNYSSQLKYKQKHMAQTIKKITGEDLNVAPVIDSDCCYFYRNKGAFPYCEDLGMFKTNSHDIVPISQCFLMNDNVTKCYKIIKQFFIDNNIKGYDFSNHKGVVKFVVIRSINEQTIACVVVNKKVDFLNELYHKLSAEIKNVGLYVNYNFQNSSVIMSNDFEYVDGIKEICLKEFNIKYKVNIASFLQVNDNVKEKLYNYVLDNIDNGIVVDAYAGAGLLSAVVSKKCSKVYSVEIVKSASKSAQELIKENNINNVEVINGDCSKIIPHLLKSQQSDIQVVLDPARVGCDTKVIEAVKKAKKIIYVSCNPIAMSKDLRELMLTHNVKSIQPFDMFPQTKHVETVCVLERK